MKKTIAISIPCFNEEENVTPMVEEICHIFDNELQQYDFFIQFIDNNSTDNTRKNIRHLCAKYPNKVRAIFNAKNFPLTSGYHGLTIATGDCTISIPCDFQVPLNTIPEMIKAWEDGAKIICLIKKDSKENKLMWYIRQLYYYCANLFSDSEILRNYVGSGLFDEKIMNMLRDLEPSSVSVTQFIVEYGYDVVRIEYMQEKRRHGKSKHDFFSLVDIAVMRFINSSSIGPRFATIIGFFSAGIALIIAICYFIMKLLYWDTFMAGLAPLLVGFFFVSSLQLFFIGLVGEYVIRSNKLLLKRPLVVERERINFAQEDEK